MVYWDASSLLLLLLVVVAVVAIGSSGENKEVIEKECRSLVEKSENAVCRLSISKR
jgi:hypothetical protein